ncbi:MAG: hypothetical protein GC160_21680 [Acidobacteria bacterium]|nr:hypothetical protein [Acidobacteriota bacterium]
MFALAVAPAFAQLEGVIDLHVHCAPDSGPRSIDAFDVARLARRAGMRALLFKNHYTQTASLAYLVAQAEPGIEVYGGIALNRSVGGLNPRAVERMVKSTGGLGRVVWMPTFDSEHYHRVFQPNPEHVPIARDGKLLPETLAVLDAIAEHGLALATGHSGPEESLLLIHAAKQRGIDRILVTHPLPKPVGMTVAQQQEAAALGAWLEYPFQATLPPNADWPGGSVPMPEFLEAIRQVGPEHVIVSSDLGQPLNPVHTDGLLAFRAALAQAGFSAAEIDRMMKTNPARFLGLD